MRKFTLSAATLAALFATAAQADETPASGKLLGFEFGDVACYLQMDTGAAEPVWVLAAFDVCDAEPPLGQQVSLGYAEGEVLAASCEGDIACGETDKVMIVETITPID